MKFLSFLVFASVLSLTISQNEEKVERQKLDRDFVMQAQQYNSLAAKEFFSTLMKDKTFHEFSAVVEVPRASVDCYAEDCEQNSELLAAFQVENGPSFKAQGLMTASIRFPNGTVAIATTEPSKEGNVQLFCPEPGVYEFCLENTFDSMTSKRVNMQIMVMHHEEVTDFHFMQQNENDSIYQLYDKLFQVFHDMATIKVSVKHEKAMARRDFDLLEENNTMVVVVSSSLMLLICVVTYGQVYYLKRLFNIDERRHSNGSTRKL